MRLTPRSTRLAIRPPPVGHLNLRSVDDLARLTEAASVPPSAGVEGDSVVSAMGGASSASSVKPSPLQYPACLALRWLKRPVRGSGAGSATPHQTPKKNGATPLAATQIVAIYGDRSLFGWLQGRMFPHHPPSFTLHFTSFPPHVSFHTTTTSPDAHHPLTTTNHHACALFSMGHQLSEHPRNARWCGGRAVARRSV